MKEFDLIVIGSGAGMNVAANATGHGMQVAVIDHGPLGGTCLNRGCIPSKVMIYPADVIRQLQEAEAIGVHARVERVDFAQIMKRTWDIVLRDRHDMERGIAQSRQLHLYNTHASFVDDFTLQVGEEKIAAPKIVIASGARPYIPPIENLEQVGYLTTDTLFDIPEPPRSLLIVGGGYIAAEFAHFFSAIGSEVTIVGRNRFLVPNEEPEVSDLLARRMAAHCRVYTDHEVIAAEAGVGHKTIVARDRSSGTLQRFEGQEILVAAGRSSNADILRPEKTGVETVAGGWIKTDRFLQTTREGIWALGDARGKHMFRHTANYEAEVVWQNAFHDQDIEVDEHAVPHAVFTYPQIGAVGLTQAQATAAGLSIMVGVARYGDTAKGYAMGDQDGFVKVIVEQRTGRILGAHAIGPEAAILVQHLVYVMNTPTGDYMPFARAQTIHPALSEVVINALGSLRPVGEHAHTHGHTHDHEHTHEHG